MLCRGLIASFNQLVKSLLILRRSYDLTLTLVVVVLRRDI